MKTKQTLEYLLDGTKNELSILMKKITRLHALDLAVKQQLSIPLCDYCKVANLRQGKLIIQTDSSVWATKLRFEIPVLLARLRLQPEFAGLTGIDFFVQPLNTPSVTASELPNKTFKISQQNKELLLNTAQNMNDERLKKVFEAFAQKE